MRFKRLISDIEKHPEFKEWSGKHDTYLANIFYMRTQESIVLQAGYYNKKTDKMASISIVDGKLEIVEEKEVFKRPETEVRKLVMEDVCINLDAMQELIKKFINDSYPKVKLSKEIIILQETEVESKPHIIWNVTYISADFKVLNIKMDAKDGKILSHKLRSIMEFRTNAA